MFFQRLQRESVDAHAKKEKKSHSMRAYDRFFEGYVQVPIPNKNGRGVKIQYVYQAEYYRLQGTQRQWVYTKLLSCAGFCLIAALFLVFGLTVHAVSSAFYVAVCQALCVFFLGWFAIALLKLVTAPRDMTLYVYHTVTQHMQYAVAGLAVAFALLTAATLVWTGLHFAGGVLHGVVCTAAYGVCFLLTFALYKLEKKKTYHVVDENNQKTTSMKGTVA